MSNVDGVTKDVSVAAMPADVGPDAFPGNIPAEGKLGMKANVAGELPDAKRKELVRFAADEAREA